METKNIRICLYGLSLYCEEDFRLKHQVDFDDNKLTSQKKKVYEGLRLENKMKIKT
jgi:hypothetical protein